MPSTVIPDLTSEITIPGHGVLSRVLYRRDGIRLVAFGFDAGEELTEHTAASAAVVQVVSGRITFTVDDTTHELGPTAWVGMPPGDAHSLRAVEPSIVLLTLVSA